MVLRNSKKSLKSTQNSTIHWLHCKTARYSYKIVAVKKKKKKHPYFLPKYSAVNWARLPLFSNEVNGKTRTLSLRCLLVLKYALEEESNSSVPGDTVKKINNKNREDKKNNELKSVRDRQQIRCQEIFGWFPISHPIIRQAATEVTHIADVSLVFQISRQH